MTTTPIAPTPPASRSWSGWRTLLIVVGGLFAMVSVALFAVGGAGLWAQQQRDGDGYFTAGPERVTTSTYALSSPSLDVGGAWPDAFYTNDFLGDIRIGFESKTPGTAVFVGIGPAADVAAYLNGVGHDEVSDFDVDPFKLSTTARAGDEPSAAPAAQSFWVASATGAGPSTLTWTATGGDWSVVIMNADGSPNIAADLSVGGTVPALERIAIGALVGAVLLLIIGTALIVPAVATRRGTDR
jgi:nitrate reductase NapE component